MGLDETVCGAEGRGRLGLLLLAKSAFAAPPHREMERLAQVLARSLGPVRVRACFSEQGQPSLREALLALWDEHPAEIRILPLVLPMEPGFLAWVQRSVARWQAEAPGRTAPVSISDDIASAPGFPDLLAALASGAGARPVPAAPPPRPEMALVPPQRRRVLVCEGGPATRPAPPRSGRICAISRSAATCARKAPAR